MWQRILTLLLFASKLTSLFAFVPHARPCSIKNAWKVASLAKRCASVRSTNAYTSIKDESALMTRMSLDDSDELLETASRLRKEAEVMEESMRGKRNAPNPGSHSSLKTSSSTSPPAIYTSLEDSSWTISYRFASDAISTDDDKDEDVKVIYYSGKLNIQLTDDGYTNMLEKDDDSSKIKFIKTWGWDEENSKEDDLDYLLLSADVMLPESDPNHSKTPTRYYFQTQVNRDSRSGEISLIDGTVTLKKDVEPPGGFWGVFNGGGILAQFRYCGEFLMKPL